MITPDDITKKAVNLYPKFLKSWVKGETENFFPVEISANRKLVADDYSANNRAINLLRKESKEKRGWGYTVYWREVRSPISGRNQRPERIEIKERDDLLRLTEKKKDFESTCRVALRLREEFHDLEKWIVKHVNTIAKYSENIEGLIAVTKYFLEKKSVDCYARQIPVDVHTKFIEDNKAVLRQWLDILLPASAIDVNETTFAGRFGLRDKQLHRVLRILDPQLLTELQLKFDELSLPIRSLAILPVHDTTVVIVENQLLLLTMPALPRTIVIRGEGKDVTSLKKLEWLDDNLILYWGDIDVPGFGILSSLRSLFSDVESIMMDRETLQAQSERIRTGEGLTASEPTNLTKEEAATFQYCLKNDRRLEQEQIPQDYVDAAFCERFAKNELKSC